MRAGAKQINLPRQTQKVSQPEASSRATDKSSRKQRKKTSSEREVREPWKGDPGLPPGLGCDRLRNGRRLLLLSHRAPNCPPRQGQALWSPLSILGRRLLAAEESAASRAVPRRAHAAPCPRARGPLSSSLSPPLGSGRWDQPRAPGEGVPQPEVTGTGSLSAADCSPSKRGPDSSAVGTGGGASSPTLR